MTGTFERGLTDPCRMGWEGRDGSAALSIASSTISCATPSKAPARSWRLVECSVGGRRRELAVTLVVDHQLVLRVDVAHGIALFSGFE